MTVTIPPIDAEKELKGRNLGRILVKLGKITMAQRDLALAKQAKDNAAGTKRKLGEILVEQGLIATVDVEAALAGKAGLNYVDLTGFEPTSDLLSALPAETVKNLGVLPIRVETDERGRKTVTLAIKSASNFAALDTARTLLAGIKIVGVVAPAEQVDKLVQDHFAGLASTSRNKDVLLEAASKGAVARTAGRGDSLDLSTAEAAANDNSIVGLVNGYLMDAIRDKASDIHMEPFEDEFRVRYRIDGVLYELTPPPKQLAMAIVSRVKVLSKLNIAERRLPQDGRVEMNVDGNPIDLRVAVLPTVHGESVVMRVLDRGNVQLSLDRVGLRDDDRAKMDVLINKPNGIVLVTGPTGSGKTTTLYAALQTINDPSIKILTAEDPVEYDIDGLIQCGVNHDQELTFAKLLRSFLRQDPDVILVGEIRDLETAQIAIQASLTGHLVFSTLHTNDAPSSILRLLDLGVESFLLTATLEAVIAQRLVRRICQSCKEEFAPNDALAMELGMRLADLGGRNFYRGRGCDVCRKAGYKGRMALYEIMVMDDDLRELVMEQASTAVLRAECRKRGMRTLRESGMLGIYEGQTTIDEVIRETMNEE
jgi:type IV pilus assembly protein PilB